MSKATLVNKLIKLDPKLAVQALRNDKLTAKLSVAALLKELNIKTKP